jgi:hypothetical protein
MPPSIVEQKVSPLRSLIHQESNSLHTIRLGPLTQYSAASTVITEKQITNAAEVQKKVVLFISILLFKLSPLSGFDHDLPVLLHPVSRLLTKPSTHTRAWAHQCTTRQARVTSSRKIQVQFPAQHPRCQYDSAQTALGAFSSQSGTSTYLPRVMMSPVQE